MSQLVDAPFDFFDYSDYPNSIPQMAAPAPEYFATAKADYSSFYDKSGFVPMDPSYPQQFMSPIPNYGL